VSEPKSPTVIDRRYMKKDARRTRILHPLRSESEGYPKKKGETLADLSLLLRGPEDYVFFLAAFLAGAFLAAFFLVAMENHPLCKSHIPREIVQTKFDHCITIKFSGTHRQM
jgi:hypothetical protein